MFTLNTEIVYNYDYDEDEDILYVSIGEPKPAITEEREEGILIRKDINTGSIIGVTILDYQDRIKNKEKIDVPKEINLDEINDDMNK